MTQSLQSQLIREIIPCHGHSCEIPLLHVEIDGTNKGTLIPYIFAITGDCNVSQASCSATTLPSLLHLILRAIETVFWSASQILATHTYSPFRGSISALFVGDVMWSWRISRGSRTLRPRISFMPAIRAARRGCCRIVIQWWSCILLGQEILGEWGKEKAGFRRRSASAFYHQMYLPHT